MTAKRKKTQRKRKTIQNANFSSLTHLKAALVGWMVGWCDKEGVGEGVRGQISKTSSDFQFPICSLV